MESVPALLLYFASNAGATVGVVFGWMAIENIQPPEQKQEKHTGVWLVLALSLLLTPIGAWVVTALIRIRRIAPTLKDPEGGSR